MRKWMFLLAVLLLGVSAFAQGTGGAGNATALQGVGVSTTPPTNNYCLTYVSSTKLWTPAACGGGGGSGTVTSVLGTANQVDVTASTTTPTVSLDSAIIFPGTIAGSTASFTGAISAASYSSSPTGGVGGGFAGPEGTVPSAIGGITIPQSGYDGCYFDSTAHGWKCSFNNGAFANLIPAALPPNGSASGDLTGSYPGPSIKNSVSLTTPNIGVATGTSLSLSATTNQFALGTTNITTLNFPAPSGSVTIAFPNTADTLVGRATTDTLTNKTLTAPSVTPQSIDCHTACSPTAAQMSNAIASNMNVSGTGQANSAVAITGPTATIGMNFILILGAAEGASATWTYTSNTANIYLDGGTAVTNIIFGNSALIGTSVSCFAFPITGPAAALKCTTLAGTVTTS